MIVYFQHVDGLWHHSDTVTCAGNVPVPWVAGYGAAVRQVRAGVGVDSGAQPLAATLVPSVQHMHHLITAQAQRAAVQVAGDIEVDPYVEGVTGS